jgi:hypothetical protein
VPIFDFTVQLLSEVQNSPQSFKLNKKVYHKGIDTTVFSGQYEGKQIKKTGS